MWPNPVTLIFRRWQPTTAVSIHNFSGIFFYLTPLCSLSHSSKNHSHNKMISRRKRRHSSYTSVTLFAPMRSVYFRSLIFGGKVFFLTFNKILSLRINKKRISLKADIVIYKNGMALHFCICEKRTIWEETHKNILKMNELFNIDIIKIANKQQILKKNKSYTGKNHHHNPNTHIKYTCYKLLKVSSFLPSLVFCSFFLNINSI